MNKEKVKTIVIISLLVLIFLGATYFILNRYEQKAYNAGTMDGQISLIKEQMNTGKIFIINNQTIKSYPIENFCKNNQKEVKK